jgi:CRP-like cAMP-binding protein
MAKQKSRPALRRERSGEKAANPLGRICGRAVEYPRGVTLFRQDELPQTIFLIDRGLVKHVRSGPDGPEVIVALRTIGSLVGSSSAVTGDSCVTTASTLTPCTLRPIEVSAFRRAVESDPDISRLVHRMHAREVREQFLRTGDAMLPALERLARLIGGFVRAGLIVEWRGRVRLDVPLSHEEMGQMIGVGRETISRLFTRLEARGVIERRKDWIFIPAGSRLLQPLPPGQAGG